MVLRMLVSLDQLVLLVHQGLLDLQEILYKDHRDHQACLDMDNQAQKETEEIQEPLCPIQEHFFQDHLGHLDLKGLKEQQVPKVQGDTKGNQVSLAFQEVRVELSLNTVRVKDHPVPQDHLDYPDETAKKGILERQVEQYTKRTQEGRLQPGPQGSLVLQVLQDHPVLQGIPVDHILLQIIVITLGSICRVTA